MPCIAGDVCALAGRGGDALARAVANSPITGAAQKGFTVLYLCVGGQQPSQGGVLLPSPCVAGGEGG
eukprot:3903345-Alexandrium_andersonii.AAC.1